MLRRRMTKHIVIVLLASSLILAGFGMLSCSQGSYSGPAQQLTIGSTHNEADSLIYIAYEQGFFIKNSLNVTIEDYSSGTAAVEGMLKGEVDIATSSEFVIVQRVFNRQAIGIIGTISKSYSTFLIARTDRGIRSTADLEGKKVGVPGQTLARFQFSRFLDLKGMSGKPMVIVNIDVVQSPEVLASGEVDAVVTWEPYASRIKEKLGDKLVVWPSHNEQPQYKSVTVTSDWLRQHPDIARRILKSLSQAESFVIDYPDQTKAIIQKRLGYDDDYMATAWPLIQLSLSLDNSIVSAMEDEARWLISSKLTDEKNVPNFLDYINEDALKAVKPGAVNVIR